MKRIIIFACLLLTLTCGLPSLEAQQRRNKRQSRSAQQTLYPNSPPVIKSFTSSSPFAVIPCRWGEYISAPECTPPGKLQLKLKTEASDPDYDALLYTYSVSGGQIIGEGPEVIWNLVGVDPGTYEAKVIVDDGLGGTASSSVHIVAQECGVCTSPCPYIHVSCPEDVKEGQTLVCNVNVSGGDPDVNPTYKWSVSAGTITKGQGTYTVEVNTTGLAGKEMTVTAEIGELHPACYNYNKESGKVQIRPKEKRTVNRPPVIKSFISSDSIIALCPFTFGVACRLAGSLKLNLRTVASDVDGDDLRYRYTVSGGQIIGTGSDVIWDVDKLPLGSYTAKVIVDDQYGGTASATTSVKIDACTACDPPCTILTLGYPEAVEEGQPLVIGVKVSGGDWSLKPTYQWSVSAGTIISGQGTSVIEIDTTGLAGKEVTATVNVGGLNPACQNETSCKVQIREKGSGEKP